MTTRIAWGMTGYGPIFPVVYSSHLQAIAYASRSLTVDHLGEMSAVGATDRMYTHAAENQLVKDFLLEPSWTHLFLTESDMLLPKDTLLKLLALDQPIASGLYFLRGGTGQPCLYIKSLTPVDNPYPHAPVRLFPTDRPFLLQPGGGGCAGLGCVLIQRSVFERIAFPWFDLKESHYGSDMYFYTKVREAKIPVWIDPTVRCDQIDYVVARFADYEAKVKEDPTFAVVGAVVGGGPP